MEQVPNDITKHDISNYLFEKSFFGSFNRAFFTETNSDLNQALITHIYGGLFEYNGANRGKIFYKLQNNVYNLKSFKDVIRYNGFKNQNTMFPDDPSKNNAGSGISARYDLMEGFIKNFSGGIDAKITNYKMAVKLEAIVISGPTIDNNPNLKIFDWKDAKNILHNGLPNKFDFPWIKISPKNICCNNDDNYKFIN